MFKSKLRLKKFAVIALPAIFMLGCQSTPQIKSPSYEPNSAGDIETKLSREVGKKLYKEYSLLQHAKKYPKDTIALSELFYLRFERFEKTDKMADLQSALEAIELLYERQPDNQNVVFQYYRLNLMNSFATGTFDYQYWQSIYQKYEFFQGIDLAPPAYLDFLMNKESLEKSGKAKDKLIEVIASNPSFANGYNELAIYYADNKHYAIALYLFEKARNLSPDDEEILTLQNITRIGYAWDHMCDANVDNQVGLAFEDYKLLTRKQPKNADFHHDFSIAARILGKNSLSKFSSKKASQLDEVYFNNLLQAYFWSDNLAPIQQEIAAIPNDKLLASDLFVQLIAHLSRKEWQKVIDDLAIYLGKEDKEFYGVLYGAYAYKMLGDEQKFQSTLVNGLQGVELEDWHKQMLAFASGNISQNELIKTAKNRCDIAEGQFVSSLAALAQGDDVAFVDYLTKVKENKVVLFYEHAAATNMLKRYAETTSAGSELGH